MPIDTFTSPLDQSGNYVLSFVGTWTIHIRPVRALIVNVTLDLPSQCRHASVTTTGLQNNLVNYCGETAGR